MGNTVKIRIGRVSLIVAAVLGATGSVTAAGPADIHRSVFANGQCSDDDMHW